MANPLTWSAEDTGIGAVLEAIDTLRRSSERTATRTAIATLVVVAASSEDAVAAIDTVRALPGQPGRVVILVPRVDVGMSAQVQIRGDEVDGHRLWTEEVRMDIGGGAVRHFDSFVEPLTFPDLPLAVWYSGGLPVPGDPLAAQANVVLVDSRHVDDEDPLGQLSELAEAVPLVDLSWLRLEPWREMTARLFDAPAYRPFAQRITAVEVWGRPSPRRMLGGWAMERLGLDPARVHLREDEHAGLRLRAGDDAEFLIERVAGARVVRATATIKGGPSCANVLPLPPPGIGDSLVAALTRMSPDPVHLAALRAAGALPG